MGLGPTRRNRPPKHAPSPCPRVFVDAWSTVSSVPIALPPRRTTGRPTQSTNRLRRPATSPRVRSQRRWPESQIMGMGKPPSPARHLPPRPLAAPLARIPRSVGMGKPRGAWQGTCGVTKNGPRGGGAGGGRDGNNKPTPQPTPARTPFRTPQRTPEPTPVLTLPPSPVPTPQPTPARTPFRTPQLTPARPPIETPRRTPIPSPQRTPARLRTPFSTHRSRPCAPNPRPCAPNHRLPTLRARPPTLRA